MVTKSKKTKKASAAFDFRTIRTVEDGFKKTGTDMSVLDELSKLPEKFSFLKTCLILAVLFEAMNNGWVPDFSNHNQARYYPWPWVSSSGFGFSGSFYGFDGASTCVGSRLCTYDAEIAKYILEQFPDLWKHWLLNVKPE